MLLKFNQPRKPMTLETRQDAVGVDHACLHYITDVEVPLSPYRSDARALGAICFYRERAPFPFACR